MKLMLLARGVFASTGSVEAFNPNSVLLSRLDCISVSVSINMAAFLRGKPWNRLRSIRLWRPGYSFKSHDSRSAWWEDLGAVSDTIWIFRWLKSVGDGGSSNNTLFCFVLPVRFQTELNYDFLEIHDGPNLLSPLIASLNGTQVPHFLFSSGSFLYLLFTTDSSRSNSGFKLFYESESERSVSSETVCLISLPVSCFFLIPCQ